MFPAIGNPVLIIANPLYDSVFKALMEDTETAKGLVSVLIERNVIHLQLLAQEHAHRDPQTRELKVFRLDFCATVQTSAGDRYQVLIELQKTKLPGNTLRFRHYLGRRYQAVEELRIEGRLRKVALPILSIYLLGHGLDEQLPLAIRVARRYQDAVTGHEIAVGAPQEFIELLTHDALFVQIPKIGPRPEGRLERLLAVFDQRRKLEGDSHRLAVEEELSQTDPVLERMLRTLNRLQESQEMEQIMTLEDLYQLEQEQLNLELEATRDALRKEQTRREEEQRRREEEQRRREEEQRRREEEQRFREEEQRLRVEQQALLQQEQSLRESAEQELQRLRTLLKDLGHG